MKDEGGLQIVIVESLSWTKYFELYPSITISRESVLILNFEIIKYSIYTFSKLYLN